MRIACAFDHAGVPLREVTFQTLRDGGHEPVDLGTDGGVYHIWQTAPNNGWSEWNRLGGQTVCRPAPRH